jgi:hypothetical protein
MRRVLWRTLRRSLRREELWSGNRESIARALGRDSIVRWAWESFDDRRATYTLLLEGASRPEHLTVAHHTTTDETATWLAGLRPRAR